MNITLRAGDLCEFDGDAIVNAANNRGLGGGGVDGAIHRAAGPGLLEACKALPIFEGLTGYAPGLDLTNEVRVPDGGAVPTPAFDLPCRWIIHTAGPVWPADPDARIYVPNDPPSSLVGMQMKLGVVAIRAEGMARSVLRACYKMPMNVAVGMGLKSIAYPAISTGVYGCPMETCAEVALGFCRDYIDWPIDVTFYIYPAPVNLAIWQEVAKAMGLQIEEV
jgi:O-acetyl-ADP-ribose deacetylase (regulator of RNase III)